MTTIIDNTLEAFADFPDHLNGQELVEILPDGGYVTRDPNESAEVKVAQIKAAIQSALDAKAQEYRYNDIASAVTYADEPAVIQFQTEGRAFRAWRSRVWEYAAGLLAQYEAGTIDLPEVDDVLAGMPGLSI